MLMTLYSTLMRRAELCNLKAENIDSERMLDHIRHGKGGRDRCSRRGFTAAISYNSCRNRHCPKCQSGARQARRAPSRKVK